MPSVLLNQVPAGHKFRLNTINGDKQLQRRLKSLGVTPGNEFEIIKHQSSGVVIGRGTNRVALGSSIACKLQVEDI